MGPGECRHVIPTTRPTFTHVWEGIFVTSSVGTLRSFGLDRMQINWSGSASIPSPFYGGRRRFDGPSKRGVFSYEQDNRASTGRWEFTRRRGADRGRPQAMSQSPSAASRWIRERGTVSSPKRFFLFLYDGSINDERDDARSIFEVAGVS